jgi:hypothetical protein
VSVLARGLRWTLRKLQSGSVIRWHSCFRRGGWGNEATGTFPHPVWRTATTMFRSVRGKGQGDSIRALRSAAHVRHTRGAKWNAAANADVSVLGHSSLRQVQKYVHPTQDHQQAEMDRIDKIHQEGKRK